jgi:diguanylate cyclase (GGDEF)-like protein
MPISPPALDLAAIDPSAAHGWHLGFPPVIEARFESDTGAQRSRDMVRAGLLALTVYDLFLVNDWFSRPEVMTAAIFWRLGVVTVFGLSMLGLIRRGLPPLWREAALACTTVVAMWASCTIFRSTTSASGVYDPFLFGLVFLAGNVMFQLRFPVALGSSVVGLLVAGWFLLQPTALPPEARPFALGLLLATVAFTLLSLFRLERAERRSYLLVLRETMRTEVAVQAADRMATLSQTDALTQLANRRAFDEELPRRWRDAADHGQSLAALLIDIDHFKQFNDRYGHPAGDACLRQVAQVMREALREDDFIARIGGEEFAVLPKPGSELSVAQLAERLRQRVEQAAIPQEKRDGPQVVSISLGLAWTGPPQPLPPDALMAAADAALYAAKHRGRNRCVQAGEHDPAPA